MPCGDLTERMRIVLDRRERLKSYLLTKKTCGGAVGVGSLLLEKLEGRGIDELILLNEFRFSQEHPPEDHIEEFLNIKHLMALKAVLGAYAGTGSGGSDLCEILSIDFDDGNAVIEADIDVHILAEKVKACAHCGPG